MHVLRKRGLKVAGTANDGASGSGLESERSWVSFKVFAQIRDRRAHLGDGARIYWESGMMQVDLI